MRGCSAEIRAIGLRQGSVECGVGQGKEGREGSPGREL